MPNKQKSKNKHHYGTRYDYYKHTQSTPTTYPRHHIQIRHRHFQAGYRSRLF